MRQNMCSNGKNVYENVPFAGGDGDYSILSVLFGATQLEEVFLVL